MLQFRAATYLRSPASQVSNISTQNVRRRSLAATSSRTGNVSLQNASCHPAPPAVQPQPGQSTNASLIALYQARNARSSFLLNVSDVHSIAVHQYGNPTGPAALWLHGGPGAATWPNHARFFDLDYWNVFLVDQRGCGSSSPRGCLLQNTTDDLVADLERLRIHCSVPSWLVVGGSWGSTLGLAYASRNPSSVSGLILRGVCLMRKQEIDWMFAGGAGMLKPAAWSAFVHHLPAELRPNPLLGYYQLLLSDEPGVRDAAARAWSAWEAAVGFTSTHNHLQVWDGGNQAWSSHEHPQSQQQMLSRSYPIPARSQHARGLNSRLTEQKQGTAPGQQSESTDMTAASVHHSNVHDRTVSTGTHADDQVLHSFLQVGNAYPGDPSLPHTTVQAVLECHYSVNLAFGLQQAPIMSPERIAALRTIPCIAVQGAQDMICPPGTAWELHEQWPEMELRLVPNAGHSMYDPRITHELVEAINVFQRHGVSRN